MKRARTSVAPYKRQGFTLLEVLVALAVVAIALAALIKGGVQSATTTAHLRDKSLAHWVAMNRVVELSLQKEWPPLGESRNEEKMADQQWYCLARITTTDDPDLRRVEVEVRTRADSDAPSLQRLIAFLPRPAATQAAP